LPLPYRFDVSSFALPVDAAPETDTCAVQVALDDVPPIGPQCVSLLTIVELAGFTPGVVALALAVDCD
jgi:hypothetical protein